MNLKLKSFSVLSFTLALSFLIDSVHSDTTPSTTLLSETTQGYDDSKCVSHLEYNLLIDSFIKQTAKEIQLNHSSEEMETLIRTSPEGGRFVQDILKETLKQPDLTLLPLLEFLNQTKLPATKLNGLLAMFAHLINTEEKPDRFSSRFGSRMKTVLNWLDLEYFALYFVDEQVNNTDISTEAVTLLREVQEKAKSAILNKSLKTFLDFSHNNRFNVNFGSEHIFFIIKSYYNNGTTIENIIEHLEQLSPSSDHAMCWSITALHNLLEKSVEANRTFQLMPILKHTSSRCRENLKFKDGSVFKHIFSENYFHLKNVYNNQYLYSKQNKQVSSSGKFSFIIKTVSENDSDKINWKFGSYEEFRSDRIVLTINNEHFDRNTLRVLPCLVHDDEFVVQMENSKYYNGNIINDAWSIEVDDFGGDRFRIKNDLSKSYLAVSMNNNQSSVILVKKLNAENYDSVHWTLEVFDED